MDLVELGRLLHERREALGIPRAVVARRIGVTPSYVWMVEQAKKRKTGQPSQPSKDLLIQWAKALGWDEPYTRQLLVLAGHVQSDSASGLSLPFGGAGALHFPQPRSMEEEALIQELRELLQLAAARETTRAEVFGLLRSFFKWLKFHLGGQP